MSPNEPDSGRSLPLDLKRQIDDRCDRFEDQWKNWREQPQDVPPRIENQLAGWDEPNRQHLFRELLRIDLSYRRKHEVDAELVDYATRFPEYVTIIKALFAACSLMPKAAEPAPPDGQAVTRTFSSDPSDARPRIGKYEVLDTLGGGGQAMTYLVLDPDLKRRVVIKQYYASGTPIERQAVLNEGQALARVRSRYVAQCLNVEREGDSIYLVMEYIRGRNLAKAAQQQPLDPRAAALLIAQVAEGLGDVHLRGLLHRDVKPANIIVCEDGSPRLVDFGLAAPMTTDQLGQLGGTLQYMAPEQARCDADQIDQRADVFGLGAVLYRLLTGRPPYEGASQQEVWDRARAGKFELLRAIDPSVPVGLERICLRAMTLAPAQRYKSADAFARALRGYLRSAEEPVLQPPAPGELGPCPYKGLVAFTQEDAHLYFGRDEQIERLWHALRDLHTDEAIASGAPRVLPLLGPSGCGKSSLAQAGLLAELHRRPLPGRENARVVVLKPGSHPTESLAAALARVAVDDPTPLTKTRELEQQLALPNAQGEYDGLRRIADLLPDIDSSPLILLIDQFEEVYTLCRRPEDRRAMIRSLLHAASDSAGRVSVIFTLRSDFLAETQDDRQLNMLVSERGQLVPVMTDDQLRRAIGQPARQAHRPLEPAVIDLLVPETRDREGALPLLQFALVRIWEGLRQGDDPADTLRKLGGVGGALAGEAQRIYDQMSAADQETARRAFLAMVQLGEGMRPTRRSVPVDQIATVKEDPQRVHRVLSRFASPGSRLVTLSSRGGGTDMAEITHEALFQHWPTLTQWLEQGRDDLRFLRRVDEAAEHWAETDRPEGLLWRSPDLDSLRRFHQRAGDEMTAAQTEFFAAADQRDKLQKRKERRRVHLYQVAAVVFTLLAGVAGVFAVMFHSAQQQAEQNEQLAISQSETALNSLYTLAAAAQNRLSVIPGDRIRQLRIDFLNTALNGMNEVIAKDEGTLSTFVSATALRRKGDVYMEVGLYDRAREQYQECRNNVKQTIDARRYADKPWIPMENLARAEVGIGDAYMALGQQDEAEKHYVAAYESRQKWLELGQEKEAAARAVATSLGKLGMLQLRRQMPKKALPYFEGSLRLRQQYSDAHPDDLDAKSESGGAIRAMGLVKRSLGQYQQASQRLRECLACWSKVLTAWEKERGYQGEYRLEINLAMCHGDLGDTYLLAGQRSAAVQPYDEAVRRLRQLHTEDPKNADIRRSFWKSLYGLATVRLSGAEDQAEELFREALPVAPGDVQRMLTLARLHRTGEAAAIGEQLEKRFKDNPTMLYNAACGHALCAWSVNATSGERMTADDKQRFEQFFGKAIELLRAAVAKGFSSPAELNSNPELDAIRDRPEFRSLVDQLEKTRGNSEDAPADGA